jgi:hypothetical protein
MVIIQDEVLRIITKFQKKSINQSDFGGGRRDIILPKCIERGKGNLDDKDFYFLILSV